MTSELNGTLRQTAIAEAVIAEVVSEPMNTLGERRQVLKSETSIVNIDD